MQEEMEKRILTGKQQKLQGEAKEKLKKQMQQIREEYELKNLGNYELIYPCDNDKPYQKYKDIAKELFET